MNNTQFRRLVLDTPTAPKSKEISMGSKLQGGGATPALGSRIKSNIPMTPYRNPTLPISSLPSLADLRIMLTRY